MDNQALQQIKDTIASSQLVSIAVSQNPSIDQMASALSLFLNLTSQGKKVTVVSPTEPIVELSSLVGIDKVKTSNEGSGGDLVVSFPYREGEIEKVSYTIENGQLNIVVKAGSNGLTFSEQDVLFKRGADKPELLFSVGVQHMADIDKLFPKEMLEGVTVINIDNNADNEGFGGMVLVSPKFSSLSEQMADLMLNLGYEIDVDGAQNLLSGISTATNNFQNQNTSYLAFEIASILMKKGAVRSTRQTQPQPNQRQFQPQQSQQRPTQQQPRPQQPRQQQAQSQQVAQSQSQQQVVQAPARQDDRQDRRDAIREALRSQSQQRNENRSDQPRREDRNNQQARPQSMPQQAQVQQPMQEEQEQPAQSQPIVEQPAEPQQPQPVTAQKPPSDWLTPKVYKGSTNV